MKRIFSIISVVLFFSGVSFAGVTGKQDMSNWGGVASTFSRLSTSGYTLTLNSIDWVGVDILMVYGGGVNRTKATISSALTAVGSTNKMTFWLSPGTWTIDDDLTISSNITLEIPPGAILSISSGKTLTLDSPGNIIAGTRQQIFSGSGAVVFTNAGKLYPEWWGAVNDGSTDDATAIEAMFTAAEAVSSGKPTCVFTEGAGYATASAVTLSTGVNVEMYAPIIYTGSSEITALTIGTSGTANTRIRLLLKVERENQSDWSDEDNIGVKLINIHSSQVNIDWANNFTIGAQFLGDNGGSAYNVTRLGHLYNGKYNLDIHAGELGFVNENLFFGGRFSVNTGVNSTEDAYGVRVTSDSDAFGSDYYRNNNNVFIKPTFELNATDSSGTRAGMLLDYSLYTTVKACRFENSDYVAVFNNSTEDSYIEITYGPATYDDNTTYKDNFVYSLNSHRINPGTGSFFWTSGNLHKRACWYDGATSVNVPGVNWSINTSNTIYAYSSSVVITTDYLEITSASKAVGIFVDTSQYKRFIVRRNYVSGYPGRLLVRAYDSSGDVLTDTDGLETYVHGISAAQLKYSDTYFDAYGMGSDGTGDFYFTVEDDVKYVLVMIRKGSNNARLKNFSLFSVDGGSPATWTGYEEIISGANIGTTSPTAGIDSNFTGWSRGKTIYDITPTSAAARGWVCVRSESSTADGGEPETETDWAVDDDQNATDGDIIGAELDDGTIHWTTINGAPAANVITVADGVPAGKAIEDGAAILWFDFVEMAVLQ